MKDISSQTSSIRISSQDTLQNEINVMFGNAALEEEFDNDIMEGPEIPLAASRASFTNLLGDLNVEVDNHTYTDHAFQIMPINTGPNNQWAIQRISNPVSEWKDESLSLLTKITIKEMVSQQSRGEYNTKSIILYHNFF